MKILVEKYANATYAGLITYFGEFVSGFSLIRLGDFLYGIFSFASQDGKKK